MEGGPLNIMPATKPARGVCEVCEKQRMIAFRPAKGSGGRLKSCCRKCVQKSASRIKQDAASAEAKEHRSTLNIQLHVFKAVNGEREPCCLSITLSAKLVAGRPRWECPNSRANGGRCDKDFSRLGLKQPWAAFRYHMQACFNTHYKTKSDIPSIEFVKRRVRAHYEFRHRIEEVVSPRYGAEWVDQLLDVRQSNIEGAHLGAFARRRLVQGKLLGIYEGRLLRKKSAFSRAWWGESDKLATAAQSGYQIDGADGGNKLVYINASAPLRADHDFF
ncbi:hypothetical protein U1Q18_044774 [Sarracenia purpurea var. burkii]